LIDADALSQSFADTCPPSLSASGPLARWMSPRVLPARVHSALRLKQEIDQRKAREASLVNLNQNLEHILTLLDHEREKSERLLLNILPSAVAVRLKDAATDMVVADHFPEASVMFIDVVSFTSFASRVTPTMLVMHLNRLFTYIDGLVKQHGLEKIKTTGDAYLVAGGVPTPRPGHLEAMADLALELQQALANIAITPVEGGPPGVKSLKVRIGLHVGPVVGGVIGEERFTYDIWGDTVNVASRMQSACLPRQIVTTAQVYQRLNGRYTFEPLGLIPIKGKGKLEAYRLMGKAAAGS